MGLYSDAGSSGSVGRFRILFVSDLRGSEVCFRKFLNSAPVYQPDLLIYGGDILGKTLIPIFPEQGGGFRWYPNGRTVRRFPATELEQVERGMGDSGRYPVVVAPDEWKRYL